MGFNYYSCEMIFFFFLLSNSKDYASWFQTKNMTISLDIIKKKVIAKKVIKSRNVSNQFGNVMKC